MSNFIDGNAIENANATTPRNECSSQIATMLPNNEYVSSSEISQTTSPSTGPSFSPGATCTKGSARPAVKHAAAATVQSVHRKRRGILSNVVDGDFQAAGFSLIPSMNLVPRTTSASSGDPFNDRQPFDALSISLKTIVRHAVRVPLPLVLS